MPRTPDPEVGGSSPTRVKPCCVLEQGKFTPRKYWYIPRKWWLRPNMTEKLFTGTLKNKSTISINDRLGNIFKGQKAHLWQLVYNVLELVNNVTVSIWISVVESQPSRRLLLLRRSFSNHYLRCKLYTPVFCRMTRRNSSVAIKAVCNELLHGGPPRPAHSFMKFMT